MILHTGRLMQNHPHSTCVKRVYRSTKTDFLHVLHPCKTHTQHTLIGVCVQCAMSENFQNRT